MDTSKQVLGEVRTRRAAGIEEKRRITQETFVSGASVAGIAQRYAVNANQLFQWRKRYREGRLGSRVTPKLLRVTNGDLFATLKHDLSDSPRLRKIQTICPRLMVCACPNRPGIRANVHVVVGVRELKPHS